MRSRTYFGCSINPMGRNSWGGRWEAYTDAGRFVRADTLAGVMRLIRDDRLVSARVS
jgi:hypothetical protein